MCVQFAFTALGTIQAKAARFLVYHLEPFDVAKQSPTDKRIAGFPIFIFHFEAEVLVFLPHYTKPNTYIRQVSIEKFRNIYNRVISIVLYSSVCLIDFKISVVGALEFTLMYAYRKSYYISTDK